MTLHLAVLRHGNTFAKGEKVVMVGSRHDLPLVESGREQARAMATALAEKKPTILFASPLARTREYGEIVAARAGLTARLDDRLRELDYGRWTGLSDEEIVAAGDGERLRIWREAGDWPTDVGFAESDAEVETRVRAFAAECRHAAPSGLAIAVSSQGILRYFLRLVPGAFAAQADHNGLPTKTGHGGILRFSGGAWQLLGWNLPPAELAARL